MRSGAHPFDVMKYMHSTLALGLQQMTQPTADLFESLVDQSIVVTTANGSESWRVTSVTRREAHALRGDQPFNVYLSAPVSNDRRQGMRVSTLPNGEAFEFFGVPVSVSPDGVAYELVFN